MQKGLQTGMQEPPTVKMRHWCTCRFFAARLLVCTKISSGLFSPAICLYAPRCSLVSFFPDMTPNKILLPFIAGQRVKAIEYVTLSSLWDLQITFAHFLFHLLVLPYHPCLCWCSTPDLSASFLAQLEG